MKKVQTKKLILGVGLLVFASFGCSTEKQDKMVGPAKAASSFSLAMAPAYPPLPVTCESPWGTIFNHRETYSIGECEICTCRSDGRFWCEDLCPASDGG